MSKDPKYETVATAVRVEIDNESGEIYLVFKITDTKLKQEIRENWLQDIEFKRIGKKLKIKE